MKDETVVYLGVGGLLAWLLSRYSTAASGPATVSNPQGAGSQGPVPVFPGSTKLDIAKLTADLPESEGDGLAMLADGASGNFGGSIGGSGNAMPLFKRQTIDLGSKIPLSALTDRDFNYAAKILAGSLDHNGEFETPNAKHLFGEIHFQQTYADVMGPISSVLGAIGSVIPVYGVLLSIVSKILALAAQQANQEVASLESQRRIGGKIRVIVDIENATPVTMMLLGNPATDSIYLNAVDTKYWGQPFKRRALLKEYFFLTPKEEADLILYEPPPGMPHPRLFTQTMGGYALPWLSSELGAGTLSSGRRTMKWSEMLVLRAKIFRCIDLMIGQFWPPMKDYDFQIDHYGTGGGASNGGNNPTDLGYFGPLYSYHNAVYGDVWESIFAPNKEEDTYIRLPDGTLLDYYGNINKRASYVSGAAAAILTHQAENQAKTDAAQRAAIAAGATKAEVGIEDFSDAAPAPVAPVAPHPSLAVTNYVLPDVDQSATVTLNPPSATPAPAPVAPVAPYPSLAVTNYVLPDVDQSATVTLNPPSAAPAPAPVTSPKTVAAEVRRQALRASILSQYG